ncbi:MAG: LysE family translocator [Pseudomonadota bacterium]
MNDSLTFILAAVALIVSPGPATLSMFATGLQFGFRRGFAFLLGCASGLFVVSVFSALGMAAVMISGPTVYRAMTVTALAYIGYLALRIARAPPPEIGNTVTNREPTGFFGGALLSLSNPKAYAATTALFGAFGTERNAGLSPLLTALAIIAIVTLTGNMAWTWAGSAIGRLNLHAKIFRRINIILALMLIASVVWALLL